MPGHHASAPTAERFDHPVAVTPADIDVNGHANNVVYLRWVQEAATAHWYAAVDPGSASGTSWVVVRHEIDYKKPAFPGDALTARTWVGEMSGVRSERFCEVIRAADGQVLAAARTVWCAIDPATGRPKRLAPGLRSRFFARARGAGPDEGVAGTKGQS